MKINRDKEKNKAKKQSFLLKTIQLKTAYTDTQNNYNYNFKMSA